MSFRLLKAALAMSVCCASLAQAQTSDPKVSKHVLVLSIDGFHAVDLFRFVRDNPQSAIGKLAGHGVTYTAASSVVPSDSYPTVLGLMTGGTPKVTGIFYPEFIDRKLSPPGSNCSTLGAHVILDETIDVDANAVDGGASKNDGSSIDRAKLALDPAKGCTPVYPHDYLHVNTIFEVAKAHGLRTAWSDKHPAYEVLSGPSGKGVDDFFNPEVHGVTVTLPNIMAFDDTKVAAVENEIRGFDHTGKDKVGVPAVFGTNFQAFSVAEKIPTGGYRDGQGTLGDDQQAALKHTDASIQSIVDLLRSEGLEDSTTIVLTAKHGQMPIDKAQLRHIGTDVIGKMLGDKLQLAVQDDVTLVWLKDQSQTEAVARQMATSKDLGAAQVLYGDTLTLQMADPKTDATAPDIVALAEYGVVYAGKSLLTRGADHGGYSHEDTNVALLVSNPSFEARTITAPVSATQVAPTILKVLGLDPNELQAVQREKTQQLPGF